MPIIKEKNWSLLENVQSVTFLHFVRFGHFIKDRTRAMFNLEVVLCNLDLHTGEKKNGIYVKRFLRKIIDDQLVGSIQFQLWNLGWFLPITCSKITIIYWPLNNQNRCVTRTFDSVFTSLIQGLYRFLDPKSTTFSRLLPKTIISFSRLEVIK